MTEDLEDLKRRLVVGHKSDGRSVYDEAAKSELVALCLQPGTSVSRLTRECGVNANQAGRWLCEHGHGAVRARPLPAWCRRLRRSLRYRCRQWCQLGPQAAVTSAQSP